MEKIKTPSRLHMGLIDMEGGLGRVDGGVGLALDKPCYEVSFGEGEDEKELVESICSSLGVEEVKVKIEKRIPDHVGFGSKTQLSLAIASGICKVQGIQKSVRELAELVGRGGTSGIGVAAFESGGFIVDGGHDSGKGFSPSRFSEAAPAPVLARYDFPWWVVCAWPEEKGAHGEDEKNLFEKYCPIPVSEVGEVSRIILMKMLPALVEKDIEAFGEGVNLLQKTGFKKIEVGLKDVAVLDYLQKNSVGGGMSSFGPVCFGICESESEARWLEESVKTEFGLNVTKSKANNKGATWL